MSGQAGSFWNATCPKPDCAGSSRCPPHLSKTPREGGIIAPVLCVRKWRWGLMPVLPAHPYMSLVTERFLLPRWWESNACLWISEGSGGGGRRGSGSVTGESLGSGHSPPAPQCCQETLPFLFSKVGSLRTPHCFSKFSGCRRETNSSHSLYSCFRRTSLNLSFEKPRTGSKIGLLAYLRM